MAYIIDINYDLHGHIGARPLVELVILRNVVAWPPLPEDQFERSDQVRFAGVVLTEDY
jgi:hypothetical protein